MAVVPWMRLVPLALLASCASYRPSPLNSPGAVLTAPDLAVLSTEAGKIERPFLKAQPIDFGKPLTPNALAVIAVLANPDLKALRLKAGVTDAQAFAARLLPDPTATIGFDKLISGTDPLNGFTGQLGLDLAALRKRRVTAQGAAAARLQVRLDLAWAEWQTGTAARLQGTRIAGLSRQIVYARASAASANALLERTQRAAGRGDVAASEVDARRLAALDAADKLRIIERDLGAARFELNKLLGLPPTVALNLAEPPEPASAPPADTLVMQAIDRRLDLQALRAGYGVAEADVHKAILDQFPNLSLTLAAARDTAGNFTLGPQIGFALPIWNRNRGGIAIARATRAQLHAEYDARLFQTRADIAAAVAGLAIARQQRADLVATLPRIEQFAGATDRAARRGDLAIAVAETAAQTLRDRQATLASLDQQIAESTIALELLSGGPSEAWPQ